MASERCDSEDSLVSTPQSGVFRRAQTEPQFCSVSTPQSGVFARALTESQAYPFGHENAGQLISSTVLRVKNTFIECELDDEDFGPPMQAVKSCPPAMSGTSLMVPVTPSTSQSSIGVDRPSQASVIEPEAADHSDLADVAILDSDPPDVAALVNLKTGTGSPHADEDEAELKKKLATVPTAGRAPRPLASDQVKPLNERGPEPSLGSSPMHELGQCRPCAWFWRPQGCANGYDCRHCHMCLAGAIKARRKMKVEAIREAGCSARRRGRR